MLNKHDNAELSRQVTKELAVISEKNEHDKLAKENVKLCQQLNAQNAHLCMNL
jgi:hypothetical protein